MPLRSRQPGNWTLLVENMQQQDIGLIEPLFDSIQPESTSVHRTQNVTLAGYLQLSRALLELRE